MNIFRRMAAIARRLFRKARPDIEPRKPGFMVHHVQTGEKAWLKYTGRRGQK